MAVYKRTYQPYEGALTPEWSRFLILPRYAYRKVFESRIVAAFFVLCFIWPLICGILIYLPHNTGAMAVFDIRDLIPIDPRFFLRLLAFQGTLSFLLTAFIGPGLVSSDLSNNALPLYFSRPFTRAEYVAGKMAVLVIPLSLITWIPGLLLFAFQSALVPAWFVPNAHIAFAVFVGSWIWILTVCLLALALSAWVKWKLAAGALLFGIFFVAAGFGEAVNGVLHTRIGRLINLEELIRTVWMGLFGLEADSGVPESAAWSVLAACCGFCLYLLACKVKPFEVEKS